jgi:ATP-dependent DNA helicase RecG
MMRPSILFTLFSGLEIVKGIGPQRIEAYKRLGCYNIRDLLYHFPSGVIDRQLMPSLSQAKTMSGTIITQVVEVVDHQLPVRRFPSRGGPKVPTKVLCINETGRISLVFFNIKQDYLRTVLAIGKKIAISGKVEFNGFELQMLHPDIMPAERIQELCRAEPIYPLTFGLTSRYVGMAIRSALSQITDLPEWLDQEILSREKWPSWKRALEVMHNPQSESEIVGNSPVKERLAYDELLAQQLSLQLARSLAKQHAEAAISFSGTLVTKMKEILPFTLTEDQLRVIEEIAADQRSAEPMIRLVQGDVGSGKTIVAFAAMLNTVEAKRQACLMVPTEILAIQHYQKLRELSDKIGVKTRLLISKLPSRERTEVLEGLQSGEIDIVIGTHALFQEAVEFKSLSLVVVDEQHRFGVEQRTRLLDKGKFVDLLMMSATPIPRTLTMVSYGDMDVSNILHKPDNRQPIETSVVSSNKIPAMIESVKRAVSEGQKVYWLCPLIEESEKLKLVDALGRYESLEKELPGLVGVVHGRLKPEERNAVMQDFLDSKIKVLVATTVIEVGVDVPDATIMIIENAERFGLSQLHQLRGRVGRGSKKSYCILIYTHPAGAASRRRLEVIKSNDDGFKIAEYDLEIRGSGDILGTQQSGLPNFRVFNMFYHRQLVNLAFKQAREILSADPALQKPENRKLHVLLHLFDYGKYLAAHGLK